MNIDEIKAEMDREIPPGWQWTITLERCEHCHWEHKDPRWSENGLVPGGMVLRRHCIRCERQALVDTKRNPRQNAD